MRHETQVLVVGAGPTGLFVASELARRSVRVRIIEKHRARQELSKALVVQARTLELMDTLGLAEQFVSRGYPAPGLNMSLDSKRPVSVDMRGLPTRFPYLLVLPQQETERILEGHLLAQGAHIERGSQAISVDQDSDGVRTTIETADDDKEHIIRSEYLVACDGTHSTVRQSLGVPFEGRDQDYIVFLADVKLNAEINNARIANFTSRRGFLSILPFLGEYTRIFAVDFAKQTAGPDKPLSLTELQDSVNAIAPVALKLSDSRWITRFRSPSRQVPTARNGRAFFVGDAAHSHSPAGGQGMNNGLQDAANLAWKLALVVRGEAPARLLDTFDSERHPVDADAQHKTDLMFKSFTLSNPILKFIADRAIRSFIPLPAVQRKLAGDLSGIAVNYRFAQSPTPRARIAPGLQAGDRAPDIRFWAPGRPEIRMFELLRTPLLLLLVYMQAERWNEMASQFNDLFARLSSEYGDTMGTRVVMDESVPANFGGCTLIDIGNDFARSFRPRCGEAFLIRPDGYLAFRSQAEWGHLSRHLASLLLARSEQSNRQPPPPQLIAEER